MKIEIDIDQKTIEEIKNDSSTPLWLKKVLENQPKLKWNEINSFEDACRNLNTTPEQVLQGITIPHIVVQLKLETIAMAINDGEVLDWNNTSQKKWYPYFEFNKLPNHKPEAAKNGVSSVGRFSVNGCVYDFVIADVGSRMCFMTEEKAHYAAQKFLSLYEQML